MRSHLTKALIIFIAVWLGAFISRKTGYYNSFWFTDILLHILSGVGFGFIFLALLNNQKVSKLVLSLSLVSFCVFGSYIWELWEFSGWRLIPSDLPFYNPILSDSLGDIACGMGGGLLVIIYLFLKNWRDN